MSSIQDIASRNQGFVTASGVSAAGLQRRMLSEAVAAGTLLKLDRGLYCLPETWEDEFVVAQHRFSRGVFSHETALYLHGLIDGAPESLTMTFPRGYNTSNARRAGIITSTAPEGEYELGLTSCVKTIYGNSVVVYDMERTLCDMIRGTAKPDLQLFLPAIKSYLSSSQRNILKLQANAEKLGVGKKINKYLEVLL